MNAGTLTAHGLTAAYLDRIAEIDKVGPRLNAIMELNPDALAIADRLDAERKAGKVRGPLHGIPVLIKDNIATADRMETTAGSLALLGGKPRSDAYVVTRLREAGAVILGKTNLSEWANFRSTTSTSGWSGRGGQTHNPYALDRDPSGSSSGSAVAVSANLCAFAIGTETDGSIVSPASVCGIVGLKPTVGLLSRTGIIPISASQDSAGPMTRTVRDAAIVLGVLSSADPKDPASRNRPYWMPDDFRVTLKPRALLGARIGVVRSVFNLNRRMTEILDKAVITLRAAGAVVVDPVEIPSIGKIGEQEDVVLHYEFKDGINLWFASLGPAAPVHSLTQLIEFDRSHDSQEMPFFGQEELEKAEAKGPLTDKAYLDALALSRKLARTDGIDAVVDRNRLDALVAISSSPAWLIDHISGDNMQTSSTIAAVAGYPNITVPAAQISGLPVGISFFGRAWSEAALLALAADFEAHTHARLEPKLLATLAVQ
jgi:amidase